MPLRKKTARQEKIETILRGDRQMIEMAGPVLTWLANATALLWIGLFLFALARGAGEAILFLLVAALPVLAFWLLGRAMPRIVSYLVKDYPK